VRLSRVWIPIACFSALAWAADERTIENPQIKLTYSATDATPAPGHRTTLVIEIEPQPKVHLYAPGVKDYLPIDWQMAESKAWTAFPPTYPSSHMLNLPAINETVPVYSDHIKLVRDVAIAANPELGPDRMLTVEGSFAYQACDDKLCYFPKTIPLKWTFKIGQPDTPKR
jgi:hypothetical protein